MHGMAPCKPLFQGPPQNIPDESHLAAYYDILQGIHNYTISKLYGHLLVHLQELARKYSLTPAACTQPAKTID